MTELQRAARWLLVRLSSFGGQSETWGRDKDSYHGYDPIRHGDLIRRLGERLRRVTIESTNWEDVVNFWDSAGTFFYFDPPYIDCTKTAYRPFSAAQMQHLRDRLDGLRGAWLLTCDDSLATREIFAGLRAQTLTHTYSITRASGTRPTHTELLVFAPALGAANPSATILPSLRGGGANPSRAPSAIALPRSRARRRQSQ